MAGGELLKTGIPVNKAIAYSLSQPIDTLVTGIDSMEVLKQNLAIARAWKPMPIEEQTTLLAQAAPFAQDGHLERYKTS